MAREFCEMTCSHDSGHFAASLPKVMDDAAKEAGAI